MWAGECAQQRLTAEDGQTAQEHQGLLIKKQENKAGKAGKGQGEVGIAAGHLHPAGACDSTTGLSHVAGLPQMKESPKSHHRLLSPQVAWGRRGSLDHPDPGNPRTLPFGHKPRTGVETRGQPVSAAAPWARLLAQASRVARGATVRGGSFSTVDPAGRECSAPWVHSVGRCPGECFLGPAGASGPDFPILPWTHRPMREARGPGTGSLGSLGCWGPRVLPREWGAPAVRGRPAPDRSNTCRRGVWAHARQRPVQGAPTPAWCLLAEAPGPWPMGRGVGYAEGGGSAPATLPSPSRRPHTGGALAPLRQPSVPLGTSWACESFAVSSQGFAGDASGFVSWGPLPEIGFRDVAGLDLSGDGSQALGDLPVLPATVAGRG